MKAATKRTQKRAAATAGFTDEERAAMRERVQEMKAERKGAAGAESEVLAKIAELPQPDRALAERIHAIVKASAPGLSAKTWYGMPAWARDGQVICYLQPAQKFKTRYATLGFSDKAHLDEGRMWPAAFALTELTPDEEANIAALIRKAVQAA